MALSNKHDCGDAALCQMTLTTCFICSSAEPASNMHCRRTWNSVRQRTRHLPGVTTTSSCRSVEARDVINDVIISAQRNVAEPTSRILAAELRTQSQSQSVSQQVDSGSSQQCPAPSPDVAGSEIAGARRHADCAEIRSTWKSRQRRFHAGAGEGGTVPKSLLGPQI